MYLLVLYYDSDLLAIVQLNNPTVVRKPQRFCTWFCRFLHILKHQEGASEKLLHEISHHEFSRYIYIYMYYVVSHVSPGKYIDIYIYTYLYYIHITPCIWRCLKIGCPKRSRNARFCSKPWAFRALDFWNIHIYTLKFEEKSNIPLENKPQTLKHVFKKEILSLWILG